MANLTAKHAGWLQQILVHHLTQAPGVVKILGERPAVIWGWGRNVVEATQAQPVVNPQFRGGGPMDLSSPVSGRLLWIFAYSNREGEHIRLYEALQPVLHGEGLTAPLDGSGDPCFPACVRMVEQAGLEDGYNPIAGAWFARSSWRATVWGT